MGGFSDVSIRTGSGRNPRKDFVVSEDFMDTVFDSIRDAYEAAGGPIPWRKGEATPVVPITVQLAGRTAGAAEMTAASMTGGGRMRSRTTSSSDTAGRYDLAEGMGTTALAAHPLDMTRILSRDELRLLAFVLPLAALAGYVGAHKLAEPEKPISPRAFRLEGSVTHIRDGDTIEVDGVPVRIANLDCGERGTSADDHATAVMRRMATGSPAICHLEDGKSHDREVGVCSIPGIGGVGEAMISAGVCKRRRW